MNIINDLSLGPDETLISNVPAGEVVDSCNIRDPVQLGHFSWKTFPSIKVKVIKMTC